jgi:MYXO-CTERM domain-containing protein
MRLALLLAGVSLVIVGAVWIGQGTGYFPYPSSSFMIDDRKWAYVGGAVLLLGLLLIAFRRRRS